MTTPTLNTWTQQTVSPLKRWVSICSSADSQYVYTVALGADYIYSSSDYGQTYTQQTGSGSRNWAQICCSSNGQFIYAIDSSASGYIYRSIDKGVTWTAILLVGSGLTWNNIFCDSTGQFVYASESGVRGVLHKSSDSGNTWGLTTSYSSTNGPYATNCLWCDPTGNIIYIATTNTTNPSAGPAIIFRSLDGGLNWLTVASYSSGSGARYYSICSDYSGLNVFAGRSDGNTAVGIDISNNSGGTWRNVSSSNIYCISCDYLGSNIIATGNFSSGSFTSGTFQVSTDTGAHWSNPNPPGTSTWRGCFASKYGNFFLCDFNSSAIGNIWTYIRQLANTVIPPLRQANTNGIWAKSSRTGSDSIWQFAPW